MKLLVAYSIGLLMGVVWVDSNFLYPSATPRPSHFLTENLTSPKPQSSPDLFLTPEQNMSGGTLKHHLELEGTPICTDRTCWRAPVW